MKIVSNRKRFIESQSEPSNKFVYWIKEENGINNVYEYTDNGWKQSFGPVSEPAAYKAVYTTNLNKFLELISNSTIKYNVLGSYAKAAQGILLTEPKTPEVAFPCITTQNVSPFYKAVYDACESQIRELTKRRFGPLAYKEVYHTLVSSAPGLDSKYPATTSGVVDLKSEDYKKLSSCCLNMDISNLPEYNKTHLDANILSYPAFSVYNTSGTAEYGLVFLFQLDIPKEIIENYVISE